MEQESNPNAEPAEATTPVAEVKKSRVTRTRAKKDAPKAPAKTRQKVTAARQPVAPKLVILFRHGLAEDASEEKPDGERSLTTRGHDRTKRAAKGLSKLVSKVDAIWSSPLLRALQTSLWVTKAYGGKVQVQTTDALLPDASPDDVLKLIREADGQTVVLVGHEPGLTRCMGNLLATPELQANLRRAGCAGISVDEQGRGTLEWMLTPRALRGI